MAANGRSDNGKRHRADRRRERRRDPALTAHHDAIYTLARASEMHDADTGDHVLRIRHLVAHVSLQMGHGLDDAMALGYDAMLHDVGKLLVPVEILRKPDPLTEDELELMRMHTVHGEKLLADRPSLRRASIIARSHHEFYDGTGYPDGLAGEAIPLEARITAAADVFDALMSKRPYKEAWSYEASVSELVRIGGTQLDPTVVEAIARCNASGALSEAYGVSSRCAIVPDP